MVSKKTDPKTDTLSTWGRQTKWQKQGSTSIGNDLAHLNKYLNIHTLNVLRVSISFDDILELQLALEQLDQLLQARSLKVCLLQIKYRVQTLTKEARVLHENFARRHPTVSTYLPLCLPPSPLGDLSKWTTPHDCAHCMFHEGKKCGGLTGEEGKRTSKGYEDLLAGGALASSWTWPLIKHEFIHSPPVCYWWPELSLRSDLLQTLNPFKPEVIWDIGGGNGFLAWLFKQLLPSLKKAYCIDPIAHIYPQPQGVLSISLKAEDLLIDPKQNQAKKPDLVVISWPTTGLSYQSLLSNLQPKIIVRASDQDGVCGVRKGQKALIFEQKQASVYTLAEGYSAHLNNEVYDDFDIPPGYRLLYEQELWHYRDFNINAHSPSGLMKIFVKLEES